LLALFALLCRDILDPVKDLLRAVPTEEARSSADECGRVAVERRADVRQLVERRLGLLKRLLPRLARSGLRELACLLGLAL
jgi:hypothetical protein